MDVTASHGQLNEATRAFIARRHKRLIGGQWVDARSGATFAVFDPSNGQQIAQAAEGSAEDEIFGPAAGAMPYDDDDDLDRIAKLGNAAGYGLAASIWTRDVGIAHKLTRKLKAGSVWINVHNFNDVALPFGGDKQSGWAREMGYEAIKPHTETKAVAALL